MTISNNSIPGPKAHWLTGLLKEFLSDTLGFLRDVQENYGGVTKFRILRKHNYLISEPEYVEEILKDKANNFIKNTGFFRHFYDIFGQGLLTSEAEQWQRHRKILAPIFRPSQTSTYISEFQYVIDTELAEWGRLKSIDFHEFIMCVTANIATRTLFGSKDYMHDPKLQAAIRTLERQIAVRIGRPFIFQDYLPTKSNYLYKRSLLTIEKTVFKLIDKYKNGETEANSVLSLLVNAKYEDGQSISDKQVRDEAITLFLAGHDSTAILLSWMFYLIAINDSVLHKLRHEWKTVLDGDPLDINSLHKLKYTSAVVDETLRLYPPAYILGRQTVQPYSIGQYTIPAGAPVIVSPYVQGRLKEYYREPANFDPDRWTEEFRKTLPRGAFIPFGGGRRTCIGEHFARTEAVVIMIQVLSKYNVKYLGHNEPQPLVSINMPPKDGMPLEFRLL